MELYITDCTRWSSTLRIVPRRVRERSSNSDLSMLPFNTIVFVKAYLEVFEAVLLVANATT